MKSAHPIRHHRLSLTLAALGAATMLSACGGGTPSSPENNAMNAAVDENVAASANVAAPVNATNAAPANVAEPAATPTETKPADAAPSPSAPAPDAATASAADPVHGKVVFTQCKLCHSDQPGKNGIGPSLAGVYGTKSGDIAGYQFSAAMKAAGLTWNDKTLDTFLQAPMKMVPGTKMTFAGLSNPKDRADVIAYVKTLK